MPLRQPHERISHSLKFTYKKAELLPFREAAPLFYFLRRTLTAKLNLWAAAEPPRLPLRRELAFAAALRRQKTEGEITRGCCLHRGTDEHRVKKRSFAFTLAYIKCFRTYSVYLSLRLPAQILYAGIHLPPQREARALPRRAQP